MTQIDLYGTLQAQQTLEAELLLFASTGATDNYEQLKNRPSINGVVLSGDKSSEDLFLASAQGLADEQLARENADNALSQRIDNGALTAQAQGASLTVTDASNNCGLYSLYIEGNSSQNGTPSPENPVAIDSIGDSGSFAVTTDNGGQTSTTATITSALPLCSVGDVKDELIFNANGTAKVIKRNLKYVVGTDTTVASYTALGNYARCQIVRYYVPGLPASNVLCNIFLSKISYGEDIPHTFIDGTALYIYVPIAELSTQDNEGVKSWLIDKGAYFVYPLSTPQEISLTTEETKALLNLETFEDLTNVFNSDNAQMSVEYWRNQALGSLLTDFSRNTNSRLTALENAIIGG